jgi:hypothetical protein
MSTSQDSNMEKNSESNKKNIILNMNDAVFNYIRQSQIEKLEQNIKQHYAAIKRNKGK